MRTLLCAVVAGVAAAVLVPLDRPGLGWSLAGVVAVAAVLVAGPRRPWRATRVGAAVAVVALLAAGTLRAAPWLDWLCVLVALPCASLAAAGGGGTWGRVLRGAFALPVSVPAAARTTGSAVASGGRGGQVAAGTVAGVALASVFTALFAAANPAFRGLVRALGTGFTVGGALVFVVVLALTLSATRLRTRPPAPDREPDPYRHLLARAVWVLPLALVDLVFVVFVASEGVVLFGGYRYVLARGGPTFAGYARSGFWELGLVTLLSLGILAVVAYRVDRGGRADRVLVRVLGGALCLLTLVVVGSALFRMSTYVDAYGYTRPRLLGAVAVLVLGVLLVLVLVAGIRLRGRWLPGAVATVVVLAVLGLVAVNPDAVVARTVIGRYRHDGHLDVESLWALSPDALPEIAKLPEPWRSCVLRGYDPPSTVDDWRAWNYGRYTGWAAWGAHPLLYTVPPDCYGVVETR